VPGSPRRGRAGDAARRPGSRGRGPSRRAAPVGWSPTRFSAPADGCGKEV
ncbi:MAG: hypothetical protein AVDCRST_MAG49-3279, partial [uncultured Thermomicrobiales bacterium]